MQPGVCDGAGDQAPWAVHPGGSADSVVVVGGSWSIRLGPHPSAPETEGASAEGGELLIYILQLGGNPGSAARALIKSRLIINVLSNEWPGPEQARWPELGGPGGAM